MASQGALRSDRCGDSISGTGESDEEGIALRVDLAAAILLEGMTQQASALRQHAGIALAQLLEQLRGALDIREEEGERSRWKMTHGGPPVPSFNWVFRGQNRERLARGIFSASLFQRQGKGLHTGKTELWVFGQGLQHDLF